MFFPEYGKVIKILDIGARFIEDDPPIYHELTKFNECDILAVDADENACTSFLIPETNNTIDIKKIALGSGKKETLHICVLPSCSSMLEPNLDVLSKYSTLSPFYEIVSKLDIQTEKMDNVCAEFKPQFLKIDIQGYELEVLKYGEKTLEALLAIHIETGFVEKYKNQPLFRDVDLFLNKYGFQFHFFTGYGTRSPKGITTNEDPLAGINQWLWADAVYFKSLDNKIYSDDGEKLIELAKIFHYCYESYDHAAHCLNLYDKKNGTDFVKKYIKNLNTIKENIKIETDVEENHEKTLKDILSKL